MDETKDTMGVWLGKLIASRRCPGLEIVDEDQRVFHIPWCNEKSGGLRDGSNDTIFLQLWAEHKNYPKGDGGREERRQWKHKFRCALNKCSHIIRLNDDKEFLVCQFKDIETAPSSRKRRLETQISNPTSDMDDCCIAIEVLYGSPHRSVRRWLVSSINPLCRICSDVCKVQALKEKLQESKEIVEFNLPPVKEFPDLIEDSKEMINEILGKMDRGLNINFDSGNVYVERRAIINIFLYDGTSQKLIRRKSRNDDPVVFKIFDFEEFRVSLLQHVENECHPCPETTVFLTIGFEAFPNDVDPFVTVPMYLKITHMQAEKYKDTILSRNHSGLNSISGFESLEDHHGLAQNQAVGLISPMYLPSPSAGSTRHGNTDFLVAVQVFYGIPYVPVARELLVGSQTVCTILHKSEGAVRQGIVLELPKSREPTKHREKINTILNNLTGGVIIKYESGNIFIERSCAVQVFLTDGVLKSTKLPISRSKEPAILEAFNYDQFSHQLMEHTKDRSKTCPSAEFTLSVGHDITPFDISGPMSKVLMYVKVTHMKAAKDSFQKFNNNQSSEPKISMPDSIDEIINFMNDLSV